MAVFYLAAILIMLISNATGVSTVTDDAWIKPSLNLWVAKMLIWKIKLCSEDLRLSELPWGRECPQAARFLKEWAGSLKWLRCTFAVGLVSLYSLSQWVTCDQQDGICTVWLFSAKGLLIVKRKSLLSQSWVSSESGKLTPRSREIQIHQGFA